MKDQSGNVVSRKVRSNNNGFGKELRSNHLGMSGMRILWSGTEKERSLGISDHGIMVLVKKRSGVELRRNGISAFSKVKQLKWTGEELVT